MTKVEVDVDRYLELIEDRERLEWLRKNIDSAYTRENIDKAREALDETYDQQRDNDNDH